MVTVRKPTWPLGQLATFELRDYRQELEHALETDAQRDADQAVLQQRLAEVLKEQASRRQRR